ncbi:GntR family transcriptional regulator [Streptomyces sp. NPDC005708]|uniref:GntR family transcriptional regulator n=1 Tax=Streptomyces sp. NPDC005708 TaxID=3154564 RepID=UPI0033D5F85C
MTELRTAIIEGRLVPGERIRQDALAEQFGVSRIPVREALKSLATVGLLKHTMNSGFAVSQLDESEMVQIYWMRQLIEDALMKPLPDVDAGNIDDLRALNLQMTEASDNGDIVQMTNINRTFHFEMFGWTGQDLVVDTLAQLWDLSMPYHSTYLYDRQTREQVIREHDALIEALENGDADLYQQVAAAHRKNSEVGLLRIVRRTPFLRRVGGPAS